MIIQSAFDLFAHMRDILTWKMEIQLKLIFKLKHD